MKHCISQVTTDLSSLIGKFELNGIPPAPRGVPKIEVTFDIDANGILNVTAKDMGTSKSSNITITNDKGRLSKDEIDRMVNDAEKYKDDDEVARDRIESKNRLENLCFSFKQAAADATALSQADKDAVSKKCEEVRCPTTRTELYSGMLVFFNSYGYLLSYDRVVAMLIGACVARPQPAGEQRGPREAPQGSREGLLAHNDEDPPGGRCGGGTRRS